MGKTCAHLFAPAEFWKLTPDQRAEICNGCGPDGWLNLLVPDTILGLSISLACDIHDYMYVTGETIADKAAADRVFMNNLVRIITAKTKWSLLMWLRLKRARIYYETVHFFGGNWFWVGKNDPGEMGFVQLTS